MKRLYLMEDYEEGYLERLQEHLRLLIDISGLSRIEVTEWTGFSRQTIYDLEKKRRKLTRSHFIILRALYERLPESDGKVFIKKFFYDMIAYPNKEELYD